MNFSDLFGPKNSADSDWKYHFNDGFTKVHLEFEPNKCHIQLMKLSFWEKVANTFLALFNLEYKPKIEIDRVISYPNMEWEIDKRIASLKKEILDLQDEGHLPVSIVEALYQEENARAMGMLPTVMRQAPNFPHKLPKEDKTEYQLSHEETSSDEAPSEKKIASDSLPPFTEDEIPSSNDSVILMPLHIPIQEDAIHIHVSSQESSETEEHYPESSSEERTTSYQDEHPPEQSTKQQSQTTRQDSNRVIDNGSEPEEKANLDSGSEHDWKFPFSEEVETESTENRVIVKADEGSYESLKDPGQPAPPQPQLQPSSPTKNEKPTEKPIKIRKVKKIIIDPNPSPTSEIPTDQSRASGITNYMKILGFGLLFVTGAVISYNLFPKATSPNTFLEKLQANNQLKITKIQLKQAHTQISNTHKPTGHAHQYTELQTKLAEIKKALPKTTNEKISEVANRVDSFRIEAKQAVQSIKSDQIPLPTLDTRLTALSETSPAVHLSQEQFVALISPAYSGNLSAALQKNINTALAGSGVNYIQDRLRLLGSNPEETSIAKLLSESLSAYSLFESKVKTFALQIENAFQSYYEVNKKLNALDKGSLEYQMVKNNEEKLMLSIMQLWESHLSMSKDYISQLFLNSNEKGFFLPHSNTGEILHFFPEKTVDPFAKNRDWSLRRYSQGSSYTYSQPFEEVRRLKILEVFDNNLIENIILQKDFLEDLQKFYPEIKSDGIEKLFKKRNKTHFADFHAFTPTMHFSLNNIVHVELGPEAYLDLQISTIKHFLQNNSENVIKDAKLIFIIKNAVSTLSYDAERAAACKTISYPALQEKSRILQEVGYALQLIDILNEKHRIETAPIAEEAKGTREIAKGVIPTTGVRSLKKNTDIVNNVAKKFTPPVTFQKANANSMLWDIKNFEVQLTNLLPDHPDTLIDAIHRWSQLVNPSTVDQAILKALTQEQRVNLIDSLSRVGQAYRTANFAASTMLPDAESMIINLELLTMVDQIMAFSNDINMNRFQVPLELFSEILQGESPFFRTFDPQLDNVRLQNMKNWLAERMKFFDANPLMHNPLFTEFQSYFDLEAISTLNAEFDRKDPTIELAMLLTTDSPHKWRLDNFRDLDKNENRRLTALKAMTDPNWISPETKQPMPSWYYSIRELSHFCIHMQRSGFVHQLSDKSPEVLKPRYSLVKSNENSRSTLKTSLEGVSAKDLTYFPEIPDGKTSGHLFSHLEMATDTQGINQEQRDLYLTTRQADIIQFSYLPGVSRMPPTINDLNYAMTQETDVEHGVYSSADYWIKWSMPAEKQLQIFSVISTYAENPIWLTRPEEQVKFLNLLFDPGLLTQHLQEGNGVGPKSEADLSKFLHDQYLVHAGNPELQVFFAEAGTRLSQYSTAARKGSTEVYQNIPVPDELKALAALPGKMSVRKDLSEAERSTYAGLKAISFIAQTTLSDEDLVEFLKSTIIFRSSEPLKMVNALQINLQIVRRLNNLQPQLLDLLYPKNQLDPKILKQIVDSVIGITEFKVNPSPQNPLLFTDLKGTIELNLEEGTFVQAGREGIPIPNEARFSNSYKMIHGADVYRGKAIDRFTFQFVDKHHYTNIVQKDVKTSDWTIYRKFEDSPAIFQSTTPLWIEKSQGFYKPIKWLKSASMLVDYTHWYNSGPSSSEIRLIDRHGKLSFRIEVSSDENTIKGIYKIDPDGEELILADIDQEAYAWARQFEDSHHIHVWASKESGRGQKIEFLRASEQGRFTWNNHRWQLDSSPQYYVARVQVSPLFAGQSNFLLLETEDGGQRLLEISNPRKVYAFDLNQKTSRFEGKNIETNLYLTSLQLLNRNYAEAKALLDSFAGLEKALSDAELSNLDLIITSNALNHDETPQAIAIRTYAAQIKSNNLKRNTSDQKKNYQVPANLKQLYLKHISGLAGLRMSPSDEAELLLKGMLANELPVEEVIAELQLRDPESAQKAIDSALASRLSNKRSLKIKLSPTSQRAVASLSEPRPDVLTPQKIRELITVSLTVSSNPASNVIPIEVAQVFDYKSTWFSKQTNATLEFYKKYKKGLLKYQSERDPREYRLIDKDKFEALHKSLEMEQRELALNIERQRIKIFDLANPIPKDSKEAQKHRLQLQAGTVAPIGFERLLGAFIKNDIRLYCILNPHLSFEHAKQLDLELQTFVDILPEWQHRQKLNKAMQTVLDVKGSPESLQAALHDFIKTTQASRQYPHDAKRLMKVMEYQTNSYYHCEQIENLGKLGMPGLITSPNTDLPLQSAVHRITVGAGKTSRLLPSLLKNYAEEGKLALAIMPDAQLLSAGTEFIAIMKDVYQVPTHELHFSTNRATADHLDEILQKLKSAISKGHPVLTSGKSLRVLRNMAVQKQLELIQKISTAVEKEKAELSNQLDIKAIMGGVIQKNEGLAKSVDSLRELTSIIKTSAPIIDEVHKEYDPRIETNHPLGTAKSPPSEYGVITLKLFEILNEDTDIKKLMHFNFQSFAPAETAKPYSEERFLNDVAPLLANKFLQQLENVVALDSELISLAEIYRGLSKNRNWQADIQKFLLANESQEVSEWVKSLAPNIRDQLGLVRGQLNTVLPYTLGQKFGERYGFASINDIMPIPFASADNPTYGSQFSSSFVRYNYLIQALLHEGPRLPLYEKIVSDMQRNDINEKTAIIAAGNTELGDVIETEAIREFKTIFNNEKWTLNSPDIAKKLFEQASNNPRLFRDMIKAYALPLVKEYPNNLKATSQHLGNSFTSFNGISGTPNNFPAYPGKFIEPQDNDAVLGRMLALLSKHTQNKTYTLNTRDPKEIMNINVVLNSRAIIDAGGLFAGEDLEAHADNWSEKTGKAVVRIDRQLGAIVIKQSPQDLAIPLRSSSISPENYTAIYGQADIVGTDIDHKADGIGVVTVSARTTFSVVEQAAGRMRGIESGQSIAFLLLEDDAVLIRESLGLPAGHDLSSQDVLSHLISNEAKKQMSDSLVAAPQKLQAVKDNYFFNWMIKNELGEVAKYPGISGLLDMVFYTSASQSPFNLYGKQEVQLSKENYFAAEIDRLIGDNAAFAIKVNEVFGDVAPIILSELKASMEEVLKGQMKYLNDTITSRPQDLDNEQEQEQMQEQNVQIEQQQTQENELTLEKISQKPLKIPEVYIPWMTLNTETIGTWELWKFHGGNYLELNVSDSTYFSRSPEDKAQLLSLNFIFKNQPTLADLFGGNDNDGGLGLSSNFQTDLFLKNPQKPAQYVICLKNAKADDKYKFAFVTHEEFLAFKQTYHKSKNENVPGLFKGPSLPYDLVESMGLKSIFNLETLAKDDFKEAEYRENEKIKDMYRDAMKLPPSFKEEVKNWGEAEIWGGHVTGRKSFGNEEVFNLKDSAFANEWVKAQVFAGRLNFAPELRDVVKKWIDDWASAKASPDKTKTYWLDEAVKGIKQLIANKEDVVARFDQTDFGKILAELRKAT